MKTVTETPLHEAIRMKLPLKSVKVVLENGCDINALSPDGYTPLIEAIYAESDDVALYLIEQGADLQFTDQRGADAVHFAVFNGCWEVLNHLIEAGLPTNQLVDGWPLLNTTCSRAHKFKRLNLKVSRMQNGKEVEVTDQSEIDRIAGKDRYANFFRIVELLLKRGAAVDSMEKKNGQSSLVLCASRGDLEIMELLIQHGADVNLQDRYGLTALHWAARSGHTDIVELLLEKGAYPNPREDYGFTPLHEAAENNHPDIIELLISAGADKTMGTRRPFGSFPKGTTPKQLAEIKGLKHLSNML